MVAALGAPAGTYSVVDDEPLTHRDYVDSLASVLDMPPPRLPPLWATWLFGSVGALLALAPHLQPQAQAGDRLAAETPERARRVARADRRSFDRDLISEWIRSASAGVAGL